MAKGYFVDSSDKLLNQKDLVKDKWNFCCDKCNSKKIEIHLLNTVFKYKNTSNNDLPQNCIDYYKTIPLISKAIVDNYTRKGFILIECKNCRYIDNDFHNNGIKATPDKNELKKFINDYYGITEEFEL